MRYLVYLIAAAVGAVVVAGCGDPDPRIAGKMSEWNVCSTAGYLIRQRLSDKYNTVKVPCSALNIGDNRVEIRAGYVSPLGGTLHYTAQGVVNGDRLRIDTISVDDIDDEPRDFARFGMQ